MPFKIEIITEMFNIMPAIKAAILTAERDNGDRMSFRTLKEVINNDSCDNNTPIKNMNKSQIEEFQDKLLTIFKNNDWLI